MEDKKILLKIRGLKKYFPVKNAGLFSKKQVFAKALDGISLDIYQGETLGLVGESGCGKSTLGKGILNLYPLTHGAVTYYGDNSNNLPIEGIELSSLSSEKMRVLRKDMQMIFQDPYSSLNPRMTARQIIEESLIAHDLFKKNSEELHQFVSLVMKECGLPEYMGNRYPHQFSGGQRQRISIARALALRPKFMVCDEPVSALDVSIQSEIINLLNDLKLKNNLTYLFISHDLSVIKYVCDRIVVMYLGNIVEIGTTSQIFTKATHPYTKALLSAIPTTNPNWDKEIIILEGDIPSPVEPPKGCKFHTRCPYKTQLCTTETPSLDEITSEHFVACHHKGNLFT